jgi:Fe-S-cluster containining protein
MEGLVAKEAEMMQSGVCSDKELLWLSCKEKQCCSFYTVMPTGFDIWRISQAMQLPPSAFTLYADAPADAEDGFALDASDKRYQVILAKRPSPAQNDSACVFLWRLPDGHAQCGLGRLRPSVCRTYPYMLADGILCVGDCSGCSCRTWALANVDSEDETRQLHTLECERREYREIVQTWNELVHQGNEQYHYLEFCDYLVNSYADRYRRPEETAKTKEAT